MTLPVAAWWVVLVLCAAAAGCSPKVENVPVSAAELTAAQGGPRVEAVLAHAPWVEVLDASFEIRTARELDAASAGVAGASPQARTLRFTAQDGRINFDGRSEAGPLVLTLRPGAMAGPWWRLRWAGASAPQRHRGEIVLSARHGSVEVTCALTLEEYLAGVLGAEMSPGVAPLEALKAQAVAARTYTLFGVGARQDRKLEPRFASDATFQAYGGVDKEHPRAVEAVRSTRGEVLTFKGRIFRAYYHSTCGGGTASAAEVFGDAAIAPLSGAACADCTDSRHARWTSPWSAPEITAALRPWAERNGLRTGEIQELTATDKDPFGRSRYVRVRHADGAFDILAAKLRALLGDRAESPVKSTVFEVIRTEQGFLFEGRGWGHGVGLCQTGAARRGEREDYRAILEHYYPHSRIDNAYASTGAAR